MRQPLFTLILALTLASVALAQRCGPNGCSMGGCSTGGYPATFNPQPVQTSAHGYAWVQTSGGYGLFLSGRQIGSWVDVEGAYYPFDGFRFGAGCEPPCPPPAGAGQKPRVIRDDPPKCGCRVRCECQGECTCVSQAIGDMAHAGPPEQDCPNHGIVRDRMQPGHTWINGREVTLRQAIEAVGASGIPDDAALPSLVLCGSEYETGIVRKDLETHAALAFWKGRVKVQSYNPAKDGQSWVAKDFPEGKPSIRFQDAKGKGYFLLASYLGPDQLAEALRKTDPLYDPKKDPNPLAPKPGPSPEPAPSPTTPLNPWAVIAGCAAVTVIGYLILRRPQTQP